MLGGTVAQAVAPTTFGLYAHGGHGFESSPMSFLLPTSSPSHFLSHSSLHYRLKAQKPKNKSLKKRMLSLSNTMEFLEPPARELLSAGLFSNLFAVLLCLVLHLLDVCFLGKLFVSLTT